MKSPAEWVADLRLRFSSINDQQLQGVFRDVQADARAGMVPEARLDQLRASFMEDCTAHKHKAQHEAELAKAWEAGREAAAELADAEGPYASMAIRALQPPGGKAK